MKPSADVLDAHSGIPLLFKLSDMAAIGPLTMARVDFLAVQTNQIFLAADVKIIGELLAFQIACKREMGLSGKRSAFTLSGSVRSGITATMLGIPAGNICAAVERGARG